MHSPLALFQMTTPSVLPMSQSWGQYGDFVEPLNYYTAGAGPLLDQYGIYDILCALHSTCAVNATPPHQRFPTPVNMANQSSPKLAGIDAALAAGPVPTSPLLGPLLPASFNASLFVGHAVPPSPDGFCCGWDTSVSYFVQATAPGSYTVTVTAGTDDSGPQSLLITVGGDAPQVQNVTCASANGWNNYSPCNTSAPFAFPAGVSVLRVTRNRLWLGTVSIEAV